MSDFTLAPHCMGQAASFSAASAFCKKCEYAVDCAQQVMTRLEVINETLDVSDIMTTTQSFLDKHGVHTKSISKGGKTRFVTGMSVKFDVDVDLSGCSIRAQKIATAILKRGIDIKADIRRGDNKLRDVRPTYLASIQDHIGSFGEISHDDIKNIIRSERPNSKETAISNGASFAAQALMAIGVIEKMGSKYVLTN